MSNLYNYLIENYLVEAENAPITYPNLYKPKEVWKIREDNPSYYGRPDNGYLTASFVMEKNLKWPDLGFNLTVQVMNGGRSLIFLTKEDAELFLKKAYENYSLPELVVAHGRGGDELVRVDNDKIGVPIYVAKDIVEWLSNVQDTKVPQYIRDRLTGEVQISKDQKEKEERERIDKERKQKFIETIIKAIKIIDPNCTLTNKNPYTGTIDIEFKKGNANIHGRFSREGNKFESMSISFPDEDFTYNEVEELASLLMPDKEVRDRTRNYNNSFIIEDKNQKIILYPKLSLRITWDVNRCVKEINNYLDNIIDTVNDYNRTEEFE